ncbi:MAG TPA: lipocalin-like domain-containing protein, partial [Rubrivivax sp.]|nr:lipocalin-like domain-containing protein [Rubrivivax sp.]
LVFPRDHGAHLGSRTEWWYATGWLGSRPQEPSHGVQITFFRSRTGLGVASPSRFAPRQLLFAHAAVLDLASGLHVHDQRIVRWSEAPAAAAGHASTDGGLVKMRDWQIAETVSGSNKDAVPGLVRGWRAQAAAAEFSFDLHLQRSQPVLLQGDGGFSRKGPDPDNASHYYSEPQLLTSGQLSVRGRSAQLSGRAWLDHEWSTDLMHPHAVGWDWVGINLFDGSALTAFVLRRRDGSALWAGGSFRREGGPVQAFDADQVRWKPGRSWRSPRSGATYPVQWTVTCPAGQFEVRALADAQELDSRASTGTIYWEGLSELLDAQGRRIGLGYLEMTGYGAAIKL